jgi:hypothetical protein
MARVATTYNNFARGKLDHDMSGRFDLPIYSTGADKVLNFITNFKGNAIYRAGLESMVKFEDCAFVEFRFSNSQNYLCLFYANKIRFLSYDNNGDFGWVLDGALNILEVATPYSLAESKELQFTQNADVMVVTHPSHDPRKLIRIASNNFTFAGFGRKDDPFALTFQATKTITGITQANPGVVTAVAHGYTTGDRVRLKAISGMTELNDYTVTVTVLTADTFSIGINTAGYTAYTSGGTAEKVLTFANPKCCLFYKGRLYYAATNAKTTTVWASENAQYDVFTLPTTVTDNSALQFTIADITQPIEWLFGGDNSLLVGSSQGIVAVNGGGVGEAITSETVEANITSADGCNTAYPVRKDGLVFYVSKTGRALQYFTYDILTESFSAQDANFLSYDITRGGVDKIRYKKDRNDLIWGLRDGDLLSVNFNNSQNIIGWHEHETSGVVSDIALITDNDGNDQLFCLTSRNGNFFVERMAEFIEFSARADFFTSDKVADTENYIRKVAEELKDCCYLDGALKVSNLKAINITYASGQITAASPVFSSGDVGKHIVYKTATGAEYGRFEITGYDSTTVVDVSILQSPHANTYGSWYLTFSTISGLSDYNGTTVGVVADGGYLSDYSVSGGAIALERQVASAWVGYKYRGEIKSFVLGFVAQGINTQATVKAINRVGIRFVTSAGGKFGASPYLVEPIQTLSQNDLNYLPPTPMDGTKFVNIADSYEFDKSFYIVQDEPLPLFVCCVMVEANYGTNP